MKALFVAAALLVSQSAFAETVQQTVRNFERANEAQCQYLKTSKNQFCFNSLCSYKVYYSCQNEAFSSYATLVLKVRRVTYPGGLVEKTVTESYVE